MHKCNPFHCCRSGYGTVTWRTSEQLLKVGLVLYTVHSMMNGEQLSTRNWNLQSFRTIQGLTDIHC